MFGTPDADSREMKLYCGHSHGGFEFFCIRHGLPL